MMRYRSCDDMPKRIVEAHSADGTVRRYRISARPAKAGFTEDEYIGIAKQYHVEDGFSLETVERWVVQSVGASAKPKQSE